VLCAESDAERDEWVETLLHYIDEKPSDSKTRLGTGLQTAQNKEMNANMHDDAPSKNANSPSMTHQSDTPSLSDTSIHTPDDVGPKSLISGPMNGSRISDAGTWGNKPAAQPSIKSEEQKKRTLFHFRKLSREQLNPQPVAPKRTEQQAHRTGHVRPVFGMQLQEAVDSYSPVDVDVYLPAVVYRCIEYLRVHHAANEEGLFRLSGSNIVIRTLKDRFNTEGDIDLLENDEDWDVHAIASLFKTYLRELPSTLLTRDLHLEFLKVLELSDKQQKINSFNVLVHRLPTSNFVLLRTLSQYLLEVVQNSERNKMTVKNMGIVFAPTLNIPAPVFAMFLTEFYAIFDQPVEEETIQMTELAIERDAALTVDDIRSPRRQMFSELSTPAYNQTTFSRNAIAPVAMPATYAMDKSNDIGFSPLQSAYESRNYVSMPHEASAPPQYPPPQPPTGGNSYGGSQNMMSPDNAASLKAKRRESSMLFL
jgi:RalA-binding protein 1